MLEHDESDSPEAKEVVTAESGSQLSANGRALQSMMALQASLGEAVMLLSRDPKWRHASLADLEWLLLPAISANQFMTLRGKVKDKDGKETGLTIPVGLALWAKVSEEVDAKLKAQKDAGAPFRLAPQDWKSGDIAWLMLSVGPEAIVEKLSEKFKEKHGKEVHEFQT